MRIFLIVIDSFGIGAMPDAELYGDTGSNTYRNIYGETGVKLDFLVSLGLNNIKGVAGNYKNGLKLESVASPLAAYGRLSEKTPAKDTTAGHYEIAGLVLQRPFKIYKKFPAEIVEKIEKRTGVHFLGNEVASGTEIIQRLGELHLQTGCPILYTSQDSVMQIAADTSIIPLQKLYEICEVAREIMTGDNAVGRIIARPFIHQDDKFTRTEDRKDYALEPPGPTVLDFLSKNNIPVIAVGKINDIFCGRGISKSYHTGNNQEGIKILFDLIDVEKGGLIFVNLVDTDMLFGHRNNVRGYADALQYIDQHLSDFVKKMREDDILIITADHGCDPTTPSTDHSREYVPLLIYGNKIEPYNLGEIEGFDCISNFIKAVFQLADDNVIYEKIYMEE